MRTSIEAMIQKHQRLPGGIIMGMVDRLPLHWLGIERKGFERALSRHISVITPPVSQCPVATQTDPFPSSSSPSSTASFPSPAASSHEPPGAGAGADDQLSNQDTTIRALRHVSSDAGIGPLPRAGSHPVFDRALTALATPSRWHPDDAFWSRCTCAFAGEEHSPDCAIHIPVTRSRSIARAPNSRVRNHMENAENARRQRGRVGDEIEQWPSLPMRFWLRASVASVWNALAASDYFYVALVHDHAVSFEGLELPDDGDANLFD